MICKCSLCNKEFDSPKEELELREGYGFVKDYFYGKRFLVSNINTYKEYDKFICKDCVKFIAKECFELILNKVLY